MARHSVRGHWEVGTFTMFGARSTRVDFMCAGPVCRAVLVCRDGHRGVGIDTTFIASSAVAGTLKRVLSRGKRADHSGQNACARPRCGV